MRIDSLKQVIVRECIQYPSDEIYFKLAAKDREIWKVYDFLERSIVSRSDTVIVPAGRFTKCLRIFEHVPDFGAAMNNIWLAPNIGLVKVVMGNGFTQELLEATINGVRYGGKTNVGKSTWGKVKKFIAGGVR